MLTGRVFHGPPHDAFHEATNGGPYRVFGQIQQVVFGCGYGCAYGCAYACAYRNHTL